MFQPHNRAGGLVFDEIKIQEGLVWDQKTDRMVGFVEGHYLDTEAQVRLAESAQPIVPAPH